MTTYINCDKPQDVRGPITCHKCGNKYKIEFDTIKSPYKENGTLNCGCGVELIKWNSTNELYLENIG